MSPIKEVILSISVFTALLEIGLSVSFNSFSTDKDNLTELSDSLFSKNNAPEVSIDRLSERFLASILIEVPAFPVSSSQLLKLKVLNVCKFFTASSKCL